MTKLGIESELIKSRGGVFEIEYSGKKVFSKKEKARFPDEGEIVKLLSK